MPRYHFNVYDGYSTIDDEGTELADLQTARREAIRLAGMVLAHETDKLLPSEEWRMEVTDPTGLILFRLDFCLSESAAAAVHDGRTLGAFALEGYEKAPSTVRPQG